MGRAEQSSKGVQLETPALVVPAPDRLRLRRGRERSRNLLSRVAMARSASTTEHGLVGLQ